MAFSYYNEIDPYCVEWLQNLISAGHIADGCVDSRPIQEIQPDDLLGFTQCHFFAGLGGWSHALRLAGWPDDRPVWTGSCPCQPFSVAGKRKGAADERHLWPYFSSLIAAARPTVCFGEQVEGAVKQGWIDGVRADLAAEDYAFGFAVLGAHSVGAPHIRQRLYWLGHSDLARPQRRGERSDECADQCTVGSAGEFGRLVESAGEQARFPRFTRESRGTSFWSDSYTVQCADGKARRVGTGIQPLAHGVPQRMGKLRAAGNAICPWTAKEFVLAYLESIDQPA